MTCEQSPGNIIDFPVCENVTRSHSNDVILLSNKKFFKILQLLPGSYNPEISTKKTAQNTFIIAGPSDIKVPTQQN